ncbi:DNA gyrase inhibitor YacG [uncultured Hydrogenophaga sp.]|uniref:DNA gyrase inhibitor YacG n=1 Tax=uncultured Hydrogenophaga sp. TaxID=199683 RepID=UPI00265EA53C|nr:DNA gyrase inhibitor YacG [uncultured Hydrogenophaga sp.]
MTRSDALPALGERRVRCPACGGDSLYSAANPFRPFCTERCRQMDLGAWASEQFALPGTGEADGPEGPASSGT